MLEINWTIITYSVIGLFVLSGFFKGWWREAITTVLLGILVFLLRFPDVTQWIVNAINDVIITVLTWLPETIQNFIISFWGLNSINSLQIDAGSGQTWLVILILFLALSILLGRNLLPNRIMRRSTYITYPVTPLGAILGGILGGLNGFLIINLVREYLSGVNLPSSPTTEVVSTAGAAPGVASTGVDFLVTDLPGFTQLDSAVAWILVGFGLLLTLVVFNNGNIPPGYQKKRIEKKKENVVIFSPPTPTTTTTTTTVQRWWYFWRY